MTACQPQYTHFEAVPGSEHPAKSALLLNHAASFMESPTQSLEMQTKKRIQTERKGCFMIDEKSCHL